MSTRFSERIKYRESCKVYDQFTKISNLIHDINGMVVRDINLRIEKISEIYSLFIEKYDMMIKYQSEITNINKLILLEQGKRFMAISDEIGTKYKDYDKNLNKLRKVYVQFLQKIYNAKKGTRYIKFDEEECPICLEDFTNRNTFLPRCDHAICENCLIKCDRCPICRLNF